MNWNRRGNHADGRGPSRLNSVFVGLEGYGLEITERIPIEISPTDLSRRYLETKKRKLGHILREV